MDNTKEVLIGAALGTLAGSLLIALYPMRNEIAKALQEQKDYIAEKAYETGEYLVNEAQERFPYERKRKPTNNFLVGSVVGALAGAGLAFLLAPKTGKQLRKQLAEAYSEVTDRTHEYIDQMQLNGAHLAKRPKQTHHNHVVKKKVKHASHRR